MVLPFASIVERMYCCPVGIEIEFDLLWVVAEGEGCGAE